MRRVNLELLAMLTAQLMAGSNPDNIHLAHVPRLVNLAEAIINEITTRYPEPPEPKPLPSSPPLPVPTPTE